MVRLDIRKLGTRVFIVAVLASALGVVPPTARAASDVDGAVDALVSWAPDVFGDAFGAVGLVFAGVTGLARDGVGLVDDNDYTRVLLRGIFSKSLGRLGLGVSQMSSGAMEGLRAEDFTGLPEASKGYLAAGTVQGRVDTVSKGLGAAGLAVVDVIANPVLFLTRLAGLESQSKDIARTQTNVRNDWVGAVK
jgi:hypothetical protein